LRAEHSGEFRHTGLHRGAIALEFRSDRRFDERMIVASVVNAVAGVEIENCAPGFGVQLGAYAATVPHIHLQHV
jgi:hypothetical protein